MKKKKEFIKKSNNDLNSPFLKGDIKNSNTNNEDVSQESTVVSNMDLTNNANISKDIIDIDDSPDVATWNKEVTRNKDSTENIDKKYNLSKINPNFPMITTIELERKKEKSERNVKDSLIDPANQEEIDNVRYDGDKLTDQSSFFHNKSKLEKKRSQTD